MIAGIIGGVVGIVGLTTIVVVVIVVWKCRKRRTTGKRQGEDYYSGLQLGTRAASRDQSTYDSLQGHQNPAGPRKDGADSDYVYPAAPGQADSVYHELDPVSRDQAAPNDIDLHLPPQGQADPYYSGLDLATKVSTPDTAPYEPLGKRQTSSGPRSGKEKNNADARQPGSAANPGPQNPYYNFASHSKRP